MMMRVSGKGNFRRFSEFFRRFDIRVHIISDLDVLIRDFDKLGIPTTDPVHEERSRLLQETDRATGYAEPSNERIRQLFAQSSFRERMVRFVSVLLRVREGNTITDEDHALLESMLDEGRNQPRVEALRINEGLRPGKLRLLEGMRRHNVHVLEKGTIEDYYPDGVFGSDKTSRAEDFVRKVQSREQILAICALVNHEPAGEQVPEFMCIFQTVFGA